jgi:hypothetical protein
LCGFETDFVPIEFSIRNLNGIVPGLESPCQFSVVHFHFQRYWLCATSPLLLSDPLSSGTCLSEYKARQDADCRSH